MLMEDTEPQSSTVVDGDLKTEISVIQGNESLQENQVVYNEQILKYNIKVTNTTNKDISNIKLTAKNTNSVFYEFAASDGKYVQLIRRTTRRNRKLSKERYATKRMSLSLCPIKEFICYEPYSTRP